MVLLLAGRTAQPSECPSLKGEKVKPKHTAQDSKQHSSETKYFK